MVYHGEFGGASLVHFPCRTSRRIFPGLEYPTCPRQVLACPSASGRDPTRVSNQNLQLTVKHAAKVPRGIRTTRESGSLHTPPRPDLKQILHMQGVWVTYSFLAWKDLSNGVWVAYLDLCCGYLVTAYLALLSNYRGLVRQPTGGR